MLTKTRLFVLISVLMLVALVAAACPAPATEAPAAPAATQAPAEQAPAAPAEGGAKTEVKPAFVYVAPVGDMGWTWAHDQARQMVEKELGVTTTFVENVPEGPDAERVIRDLAQKGFNPIFTTSFGFMDPTINVAEEFPDTTFVHVSGYKTADNVSTVFGGIEEARYLSGLVAGKMTKSNILGYVAAFPIPEVIRGINAFAQGAREANPNAEVRVVWTSTWFDPPKEKEAADALLAQGADVIAQHQDTTEPQKAAKDKGVYSSATTAIWASSWETPCSPARSGTGVPSRRHAVKVVRRHIQERGVLWPSQGRHLRPGAAQPAGARRRQADGREAQAGADRRQVRCLLRTAQDRRWHGSPG